MSDELVTLATYRFPAKAEAARWALEQEGIESFVMDANTISADWFLGNAIGYVKLQVRSSDAEAASGVLRSNPRLLDAKPKSAHQEEEAQCLSCGALMADDDEECGICGWTFEAREEADDD
jgi:ribosomal protein S27AE